MSNPSVLFLCTGNSCRSQMAEGWALHLWAGRIDAYSAGTRPQGLNPLAVKAMAEVGIDISRHTSKSVTDLGDIPLDLVITVCGSAHENCPVFPGKTRVKHVGFDDPPHLAAGAATEEEAMEHYRRVRDEIGQFMKTLPDILKGAML